MVRKKFFFTLIFICFEGMSLFSIFEYLPTSHIFCCCLLQVVLELTWSVVEISVTWSRDDQAGADFSFEIIILDFVLMCWLMVDQLSIVESWVDDNDIMSWQQSYYIQLISELSASPHHLSLPCRNEQNQNTTHWLLVAEESLTFLFSIISDWIIVIIFEL